MPTPGTVSGKKLTTTHLNQPPTIFGSSGALAYGLHFVSYPRLFIASALKGIRETEGSDFLFDLRIGFDLTVVAEDCGVLLRWALAATNPSVSLVVFNVQRCTMIV